MSRRYFTLLLPFLLLGTALAMPPQQTPEKAAQEAAESWLRLIDAGRYAESWDELADVAKAKVKKESWGKLHNDDPTANGAGEARSRKLIRARSTSSLAGTRDKAGVELVYMLREGLHHSTSEIIELVQEEARGWRVAFYMRMSYTYLFWPSSPTTSREEPLVDPMPTGDPKGVPGPPASGIGTGGGIGSGSGMGPGDPDPGKRVDSDHTGAQTAVDQRPVALNRPSPRYTLKAREEKIQGMVSMRVLIGEDGLVKQVRIVRGLPDGLNEEAMRTAYELRFKPAMKDGKPVPFWTMINISFNLR